MVEQPGGPYASERLNTAPGKRPVTAPRRPSAGAAPAPVGRESKEKGGQGWPPFFLRGARGRRRLLDLDGPAGLLEVGLELLGLLLVDPLLDRLGGLVDERLGLLEAQAGGRADDLDDLDLLLARRGEHD